MVFYRKYRPQNLIELIGQDHIKKTLLASFTNDKLAHAYLFCGPRGSGKTSTARILAKIVNCESKATSDERRKKIGDEASDAPTLAASVASDIPCNKCSSCLSITDGSNLDLIEIDAASNRGIDDIRDLKEKIKLAPSSLKKKIYIIDEVHMLTTEAFNALLKTLEEPPAHVLFILATTEVGKLPQTILSRVQRFDFKSATMDEIKQVLKSICEKENFKTTGEVLSLIAECSEGSFRDAVKLLDQVASMGEVGIEEIRMALRSNDFSEIRELLSRLISKDSKAALTAVALLSERGVNIKEFTSSVLRTLRQILLIKNQVLQEVKDEVGSQKFEAIKELSEKMEVANLLTFIENFQKSLEQLKYTTIPSLPLEVAVIKSVSSIKYQVSSEAQIQQSVIPGAIEESVIKTQIAASALPPRNDNQLVKNQQSESIPSIESLKTSDDVVAIADKWTYILETIRPYNYSLEALLKQAKVKNCDGLNVILEVPYSFHQRILEAPKSKTLLESVLADVLGKSIKVTTVITKREVKAEEHANVELAQDDEIVRLASEIFNS